MQEVLLNLHVEALDEGGYLATSSELPGLLAQGRTIAETVEIAQDVARMAIRFRLRSHPQRARQGTWSSPFLSPSGQARGT